MISRKKTAEREKIKLEIAKLVSENDEFTKKIAHYRSIINHAIVDGLDGYYTYFDISENGNQFVVLGTKNDIKSWCKRQGFVFEDIAAHKHDASETTYLVTTAIMSIKLLEWIDEEICSLYYTYSNPEGYLNTNKNRKNFLTKLLEERLDDTIIMYINRRIFWASPCKLSNHAFLRNQEWMNYWCKIPMPDVAEAKAEADYEEGANIALSHPDDEAMTRKAISKLKSAIEYYHVCGMTRRAALGSALVAGLSAKLRNRQDMLNHAKYAVDHLDKAFDRELIDNCKGFLFEKSTPGESESESEFASWLKDWIAKEQETSKPAPVTKEPQMVQIYRIYPEFVNGMKITGYLGSVEESKISMEYIGSLWGGGTYQIQHIAKDKHGHDSIKSRQHISIEGHPKPAVELNWKAGDNTAPNIGPPLSKKHILVTKPPITVSLNAEEAYQNIKPKKRSEATKKILSNSKAKQPKPCAKEIDFVKAAVSGNLFKDIPEEPD